MGALESEYMTWKMHHGSNGSKSVVSWDQLSGVVQSKELITTSCAKYPRAKKAKAAKKAT